MQKPRPVYPSFALVLTTKLRRHIAWADRRLRLELREAFSRLQMGSARDMDLSHWSMITIDRNVQEATEEILVEDNITAQTATPSNVTLRPSDDDVSSVISYLDLGEHSADSEENIFKRLIQILKDAIYNYRNATHWQEDKKMRNEEKLKAD